MNARIIHCIVAIMVLCACDTTYYYPNGRIAVKARSNHRDFKFQGGGITTSSSYIDNASPAYVHWAGATDFGATVASGAFALNGTGSATQKAAVLLGSHVTPRVFRPRATPIPVSNLR